MVEDLEPLIIIFRQAERWQRLAGRGWAGINVDLVVQDSGPMDFCCQVWLPRLET
jgi:hypothetical protein